MTVWSTFGARSCPDRTESVRVLVEEMPCVRSVNDHLAYWIEAGCKKSIGHRSCIAALRQVPLGYLAKPGATAVSCLPWNRAFLTLENQNSPMSGHLKLCSALSKAIRGNHVWEACVVWGVSRLLCLFHTPLAICASRAPWRPGGYYKTHMRLSRHRRAYHHGICNSPHLGLGIFRTSHLRDAARELDFIGLCRARWPFPASSRAPSAPPSDGLIIRTGARLYRRKGGLTPA